MQMGFYFNQTRCIGCCTCVVACKDWHNIPAGPASWRRVITIEKGRYPDLFLAFLSTACHHCSKPACLAVCPVNAITKRETDGVVVVNRKVCLGNESCSLCLEACPYDAPQFGSEENAKMQKCDFCFDRLAENKKPICVDACPLRALDAGNIDDLQAKHGNGREAEYFVYQDESDPCTIFKPKKDSQGLAIQRIEVTPLSSKVKE